MCLSVVLGKWGGRLRERSAFAKGCAVRAWEGGEVIEGREGRGVAGVEV